LLTVILIAKQTIRKLRTGPTVATRIQVVGRCALSAIVSATAAVVAIGTLIIDEYIIDCETGGDCLTECIIGEIVSDVENLLVQVDTISFRTDAIVEKIRLYALDASI